MRILRTANLWSRWLLAAAILCSACADPRLARIPSDADEYIVGVQYEDSRGLLKRMGPFRAAISGLEPDARGPVVDRFEALIAQGFADYDAAKQGGPLRMEADGIALLQALAVGKGIYYHFDEVRPDASGDAVTAVMEVRLDYSPHRFETFPDGTKVFLLGEPLGTVHVFTVGEPPPEPLRLVETLRLEWHLKWYPALDVYPEGWCVESIAPLPESVTYTSWSPSP